MVRVFVDGGIFFVWYDWKLWVIVMLWYYILMKCVDVICYESFCICNESFCRCRELMLKW